MECSFTVDGRLVAMLIRADSESYGQFPPFSHSDEERGFLQTTYDIDLGREPNTKAYVNTNELPLQITLLNRAQGSVAKLHVRKVLALPTGSYRRQSMLTLRGRVRIGAYTVDSQHLADLYLELGDLALLTEG